MHLSIEGEEKLFRIMSQLEFSEKQRPEALRLAFIKGLAETKGIPEKVSRKTRFEFPQSVIAKGEEVVIFKHLIIDKAGEPLDDKLIEDYMTRFIEEGLILMSKEVEALSDLDNYMLYLVDKHG
ncbi:hypothetical protein ACFCP7_24630 [Paenibacillus elgii]